MSALQMLGEPSNPQDGIAGGYGGAHELVERFKEEIRLDFVDVKEHFVIKWP
ncbi:hypothetical protein J7L29_02355 [Candidatus Bathyarchaeota archaeon]|nr:hypothetical protein [Candidatus Bathyarchaeota archaeon]